ncbi:hypothetical protein VNO77_29464 [Canavalia gladiata]|uniref:Uncharacterized protein n=1 Tax=Canavalia gladiata TaxID=3824 RepID=A0AAN9KX85_CANGL
MFEISSLLQNPYNPYWETTKNNNIGVSSNWIAIIAGCLVSELPKIIVFLLFLSLFHGLAYVSRCCIHFFILLYHLII